MSERWENSTRRHGSVNFKLGVWDFRFPDSPLKSRKRPSQVNGRLAGRGDDFVAAAKRADESVA
jgi:hypothetical protein